MHFQIVHMSDIHHGVWNKRCSSWFTGVLHTGFASTRMATCTEYTKNGRRGVRKPNKSALSGANGVLWILSLLLSIGFSHSTRIPGWSGFPHLGTFFSQLLSPVCLIFERFWRDLLDSTIITGMATVCLHHLDRSSTGVQTVFPFLQRHGPRNQCASHDGKTLRFASGKQRRGPCPLAGKYQGWITSYFSFGERTMLNHLYSGSQCL